MRLDFDSFKRINPKAIKKIKKINKIGTSNRDTVKQYIKENPGLNNKEISYALETERSIITDITQKLIEQKIIIRGNKVLCDGYQVNTFFIVER